MNNKAITTLAVIMCALLLVAIAISEKEIRELKIELQEANATISELQQQNDNLVEELEAQIRRAEEAESELEAYNEQVYYAPSYGSIWYENDDEESELSAKEWIAWRESGGDYNARNGQYIGRYQLSEDKLGGDWSEEHQEEVADAYVADRYGSWEAAKDFWERNGWY